MNHAVDFEHELVRVSAFSGDDVSGPTRRAYRVRGLRDMRVRDLLAALSDNETFPLYPWKAALLVLVPLQGGRPFAEERYLRDIPTDTEFLVTLGDRPAPDE
jgi:hypothetical protein